MPCDPGTGSSSKKCSTSPWAGSQRTLRTLRLFTRLYAAVHAAVVVVSSVRRPGAVHLCVKRPVGNVEAVDRVRHGPALQGVGGKPAPTVPGPDRFSDRCFLDPKRKEAGGANRSFAFLIVDQLRRAAEIAVLSHTLRFKDTHRLTASTANGSRLGLPSPHVVGQLAKGLDKVYFLGLSGFKVDFMGSFCPAKRTDQRLPGRMPFGLSPTGRAGMFFEGRQFRGSLRHGQPPDSTSRGPTPQPGAV